MTNREHICSLPIQEFAKYFIYSREEPQYDEGFDGEWVECGFRTVFITSDGKEFWDDAGDALEHECWWLEQEYAQQDRAVGHWILLDECSNEGVYCSVCSKKVFKKEYANQKMKSKYCPNCGARMSDESEILL